MRADRLPKIPASYPRFSKAEQMSEIRPFRAVRFDAARVGDIARVVAPRTT